MIGLWVILGQFKRIGQLGIKNGIRCFNQQHFQVSHDSIIFSQIANEKKLRYDRFWVILSELADWESKRGLDSKLCYTMQPEIIAKTRNSSKTKNK